MMMTAASIHHASCISLSSVRVFVDSSCGRRSDDTTNSVISPGGATYCNKEQQDATHATSSITQSHATTTQQRNSYGSKANQ
jgi:hypothetical protein